MNKRFSLNSGRLRSCKRPELGGSGRKPEAERKSRAERKPVDVALTFKTLVLSVLYNLPDDQIEYQVRDQLSFM